MDRRVLLQLVPEQFVSSTLAPDSTRLALLLCVHQNLGYNWALSRGRRHQHIFDEIYKLLLASIPDDVMERLVPDMFLDSAYSQDIGICCGYMSTLDTSAKFRHDSLWHLAKTLRTNRRYLQGILDSLLLLAEVV